MEQEGYVEEYEDHWEGRIKKGVQKVMRDIIGGYGTKRVYKHI